MRTGGIDRLANASAVVLAAIAAYGFAEYAAGRDPIFCAYAAGSPEEISCLGRRQFWVGVLGLVGLLFTVIYTGRAAKAAADSAKVAESSLRDTQRAFVGVEPLGLHSYGSDYRIYVGHILIKNVGHLPATNLRWWVAASVTLERRAKSFGMSDELRGPQVILPQSSIRRGTKPSTNFFAASSLEDIDAFCYVWGQVRYNDGFGVERCTRFCHRYNLRGLLRGEPIKLDADRGRQHEFGNDAT